MTFGSHEDLKVWSGIFDRLSATSKSDSRTSSTKAKKTIPDRHFTPEPAISMTEPEVNNSDTQIKQNVPQIDSGAENPLFRNVTQVEDSDDDYTSAKST